ncbi:hypothetical protein [Okeania sp. SIO1I7]|uniref:hypothetical protein n=1 Tax=Okeania sp. SIO1I7 TaxID=2607772 RepID=UPI0013FB61F6|nr:hypothetical protein [Okeania sp. SIO1I7]NET29323.1 hypothetical protein [Okeania sp. SIO1I7]
MMSFQVNDYVMLIEYEWIGKICRIIKHSNQKGTRFEYVLSSIYDNKPFVYSREEELMPVSDDSL